MRIAILLLLLPLPMLTVGAAHAAKPTSITFTVNSANVVIMETRTVDGITFITAAQNLTFTGGMQGSSTQIISGVIQSDGQYTLQGKGTFTGTINDSQQGALDYRFSAAGTMNPYTQNGHVTFGGGTGGLDGIHIEGPYHSTSPVVTTITLSLHLPPD